MLTTAQVRNRTKDVTRRLGWADLQPGTILNACVKCQGLKAGEKMERICQIRVADVRIEPLAKMTENIAYGISETKREGFEDHPQVQGSPSAFVEFFCNANAPDCTPATLVTRVQFEYL